MEIQEIIQLSMFIFTFAMLAVGFPVAFTLAGSALAFAGLGVLLGEFDPSYLTALPDRIFGIMRNDTLLAVPLFILMGTILERTKLSEMLLDVIGELTANRKGGLGVSICLVGGLLAASTGIVGATVVTMGLISLPAMLKARYSPSLASGIICASGTLGQIIPPSIVLIILGDVIGSAHQQAQLALGNWSPTSVNIGDLFLGALLPGIILMLLYMAWVTIVVRLKPSLAPLVATQDGHIMRKNVTIKRLMTALFPPLTLILLVLGSILTGIATPTEAASVGAIGALALAAFHRQLNLKNLKSISEKTALITTMVFTLLIGASVFSLVFRGYGGDETVQSLLMSFDGNVGASFALVMFVIFLMGFFLDFFEIVFVVVPLVGPALLQMGLEPIWLGVMIAINLQTSFLTPPFGFALFYLRGVAPKEVSTRAIYRGVIPFIAIQIITLVLLWYFPGLVLTKTQ